MSLACSHRVVAVIPSGSSISFVSTIDPRSIGQMDRASHRDIQDACPAAAHRSAPINSIFADEMILVWRLSR